MRTTSSRSRLFAGGLAGVLFVGVAACWTAGCTKREDDREPRARLESETGTRWVVKLDPVTNTPRIAIAIDPIPPSAVNGVSYEIAARSFLDKYKDLFALKDVFADLAYLSTIDNPNGETIAVFQQKAGGLPVDRRLLTVTFRADKSIAMISGATRPKAVEAVATPAFTADAARAAAEADLKKRYPDFDPAWIKVQPVPESVLYPDGAGAKLAWAFRVTIESANVSTVYSYRFEAQSGALLEGYEDRPGAPGSGTDALGATRALRVTEDGANPGAWIMVQSAEGGRSAIATGSVDTNQFPLRSTSLTTWDQRASVQGGTGAAVSAHANLAEIQDYFRSRFQWSSFDNRGTPLKVYVHDPKAKAQSAYWDTADGSIHFDDGTAHQGGPFKPFAAAMDVCGHEYTHAVMQYRIPGGGLAYQGESGAVSEALADIFGTFAEQGITGGGGGKPELFGDNIFAGGFRDLAHPTNTKVGQNIYNGPDYQQPDSMKKKFVGFTDGGGVHINSGIVSNAWWLMTMGGMNDTSKLEVRASLGMKKSEDLWWNASAEFQPTMGIADAADITIATALRMYKAKTSEFAAVACAWVATEVLTAEDVKADFGVDCKAPPCVEAGAGKPICSCRNTDADAGGSLCRTKPEDQLCREVQSFEGQTGNACAGYVLVDVTVSRCFCSKSDGNILCPKPVQFTPPRGCPEEGGFKSYFGDPGTGCSGSYADVDADGNEINKSGSGTLTDCSIEGTDRKWESASGILDCAGDDGGGNTEKNPYACP